jgi:hypothetical protein
VPALPDGGPLPPAQGLIGTVRNASGVILTDGHVFLVPASRVKELAQIPFDLTLTPAEAAAATWDEPLEDVIASAPADLLSSEVDRSGQYRFESVGEGAFFIVFSPGANDATHLPGGDKSRTPRATEALRGVRIDLTVSSSPSSSARYVGSTSCLTCHGRHGVTSGAHALTLRVPKRDSVHQDSGQAKRIDESLAAFEQGKTLFFYDCAETAPSGDTRACSVRDQPPAPLTRLGFVTKLVRDAAIPLGEVGEYAVDVGLVEAGPFKRYPVVLTLGGVLSYQQFIARVPLPDGGVTHWVLPFSYQFAGSEQRASPRDYPWVSYRAEDWLDLAQKTLREPAAAQSFDRQCAGCHVTGLSLHGSDQEGYRASAAKSSDGVFDLDDDGKLEELNVGCEACHGPGSEHIENAPRGQFIVSPSRLTPERQVLLCGRCHSNPRGRHGEMAPLSDEGRMPAPGISRRELAAAHVTRMDADATTLFPSGDSSGPAQQYTDFVRSAKYRNDALLVTCGDCHDAHRTTPRPADLAFDPQDDAACVTCHNEPRDLHAHALEKAGYDHQVGVNQTVFSCTSCHFTKTATGGAHVPGLLDLTPTTSPLSYLHGDRSSHRFEFVGRERAREQPVPATDGCAACHGEFLPNL